MAFPTHFCVCALFLLRSLEGTLVVAQWIWLLTFSTLFVAFGEKEEGWAQGHGRRSGVSLSDNEDCGAQTRPWKSQGTTWPITIKGHCCYSAARKRIGWYIFKHQLNDVLYFTFCLKLVNLLEIGFVFEWTRHDWLECYADFLESAQSLISLVFMKKPDLRLRWENCFKRMMQPLSYLSVICGHDLSSIVAFPTVFNGSVLWPYAILNEQQGFACKDSFPTAGHFRAEREQLGSSQSFHRQWTKDD